MKKTTLLAFGLAAVLSLGALFGSHAQAADSYQYYKKAQTQPAHSWNGYYIEGNVGYAVGDVNFSGPAAFTVEPKGITAGLGVGYDWHLSQSWVLGMVADVNFTGAEQVLGVAPGIGISADLDYFGTVRGNVDALRNRRVCLGPSGEQYLRRRLERGRFRPRLGLWRWRRVCFDSECHARG